MLLLPFTLAPPFLSVPAPAPQTEVSGRLPSEIFQASLRHANVSGVMINKISLTNTQSSASEDRTPGFASRTPAALSYGDLRPHTNTHTPVEQLCKYGVHTHQYSAYISTSMSVNIQTNIATTHAGCARTLLIFFLRICADFPSLLSVTVFFFLFWSRLVDGQLLIEVSSMFPARLRVLDREQFCLSCLCLAGRKRSRGILRNAAL